MVATLVGASMIMQDKNFGVYGTKEMDDHNRISSH